MVFAGIVMAVFVAGNDAGTVNPSALRNTGIRCKVRSICGSDDGTSIQLWDDDGLCEEEIVRLAPGDLKGWRAMGDVKRRLRAAVEELVPWFNREQFDLQRRAQRQEMAESRAVRDHANQVMSIQQSYRQYAERVRR